MNYEETLQFLYSQLPIYQRQGKVAYKKDLTNTIALLNHLGNPHLNFKSVHIAGTNGKGSSAHMIAAILQTAGYKTGLYTSPHLKQFTERIKVNGEEVAKEFIIDFTKRAKKAIEEIHPSFFEMTVAMAFEYFSNQNVDIAIIETGLGGRLDSTNVIQPEISLITNIGYDHMDMLGDTLPLIAGEKAGIIKHKVPVVLGEYQPEVFHVFAEHAQARMARILLPGYQWPKSLPYFKRYNVNGVLGAIKVLVDKGWKIDDTHIREGIEHAEAITHFKGRLQLLGQNPLVIADVSHNVDGLLLLFKSVGSDVKGRVFLIFGTVKDKQLDQIFSVLPSNWSYIWTQSHVPRSLKADELARLAQSSGLEGIIFEEVNLALAYARQKANPEDLILITGSTFIVAELDEL